MANHVDNFITVVGNEAATAEFESIFSSIFSEDKGLRDAAFLPRDEDGQVDMNSIGAKWAYVEDASEGDCFKLFDKNDKEQINAGQLKQVLSSYLEFPISDSDIKDFVSECGGQQDGTGQVTMSGFIKLYLS